MEYVTEVGGTFWSQGSGFRPIALISYRVKVQIQDPLL